MSANKRIKDDHKDNLVFPPSKINPACFVPESTIFLSFQYITKDKRYNFDYIYKQGGNALKIIKPLFECIEAISDSTWKDLRLRGKRAVGGFETLEYYNFKDVIANKLPSDKNISSDTKLYTFRFGSEDKYRMIGFKSRRCKAAMHIIGFDFDHSLYNHGK